MKCPHCLVDYHDHPRDGHLTDDKEYRWMARTRICSSCERVNVELVCFHLTRGQEVRAWLVHPKGTGRPPCPSEVPPGLDEDYSQACLTLHDSPKASAALSRRCLQHLLVEHAEIPDSLNLYDQIEHAIVNKLVPSHLQDSLHLVRVHGNFGAHPIKSTNTGEIMEVEPGEADLNLDVLEGLFDHFFVQPAMIEQRLEATNKKLVEAGKDPIKRSPAREE